MKKRAKIITSILIVVIVIIGLITGIKPSIKTDDKALWGNEEILQLESRKSFDFFWQEANTDNKSSGYGLIRDRAPGGSNIASIASVGYGLSAITIGVERKWISYDEGYERALGTLNTMLNNVQQEKGFFYHFINMNTGKREWNSEASIIDTAIALCGAIQAGEYFGKDVKKKADEIYRRVDWTWYRNPQTNQFYMGYTPEKGFFGAWDMTAEQFMMYFLGAGSPTHPVPGNMFYAFSRAPKSYGFYPAFIQSPAGSIFTYQYSFAWFDLRNKVDNKGINWWGNSVIASKASRQYSIDNSSLFKTFGQNSWGVTASDGPNGYSGGYGMNSSANDGTIAPSGAAGSIVFAPRESVDALNNYYNNEKQLWGKYGFKDAYNTAVSPEWYDTDYIGIDKGITLLMIENYRSGLIWNTFMKNKYVQDGMKKAGLSKVSGSIRPVAENVIIDGMPPFVGQTLTARYDYFSPKGIKEGQSTYKWFISSSKDGDYKEIPGANSLTYKIKAEDEGKYIKFQVVPKAADSIFSIFGSSGKAVSSDSLGEISLNDPRRPKKLAVSDEKVSDNSSQPTEVKVIDDFDSNKSASEWKDAGDGAYKLEVANGISGNNTKVLKVDYSKGSTEWAYFYTMFDDKKDFSGYNSLSIKAKGNAVFILKFEDASGQGVAEKQFRVSDEGKWQELRWSFMDVGQKLKDIKRILIFAAPGEKSKSGEFYIDDLKLDK